MNELYICLFIVSLLLLGKLYRDREVVLYTSVISYTLFAIGSFVIVYSLFIMIGWIGGI